MPLYSSWRHTSTKKLINALRVSDRHVERLRGEYRAACTRFTRAGVACWAGADPAGANQLLRACLAVSRVGLPNGLLPTGVYRGGRPFYLVCPVLSTKKLISVSSALPLDAPLPLLDEQIVEMSSHC